MVAVSGHLLTFGLTGEEMALLVQKLPFAEVTTVTLPRWIVAPLTPVPPLAELKRVPAAVQSGAVFPSWHWLQFWPTWCCVPPGGVAA